MKWKKISPAWNPEKKNDEIEGKILGVEESKGKYKSKVYVLETENSITNVFGCTVMDDKLKYMGVGDFVKIVFLGKVKGKEQEYNDFDIFKGIQDKKEEEK